jgi:hypothetical protein
VTDTTNPQNDNTGRRPLGRGALIGIGAGVLAVVLLLVGFLVNNSVTNTGNKKEATLNAQYLDNQNYLSDCITKIREVAGVTKAQSDSFTQAMNDAVKGRYDGRSAQPGAMFSAIVENYPDLTGLNQAFERAYTTIIGCRTDYRNIQSKLLDMLRDYDSWRTGSLTVRTFGGDRPSDNLVAQIGSDRSRKGQAALDQMYTIVLVKDAKKAYEEGELTPEDPFGTTTAPSATPTR